MDQKTIKDSPNMSEEEIADRIRYLVAITGKGPVGAYTGKWTNAIDERGLMAHCVNPNWADWDVSASTNHKEDKKAVRRDFVRDLNEMLPNQMMVSSIIVTCHNAGYEYALLHPMPT